MRKWWQRFRAWLRRRATPREDTWIAIGRAWRYSAWSLVVLVLAVISWRSASPYGFLGIAAIFGLLLLACLAIWLALILLSRLPSGVRGGLLLLVVPLIPVALFSLQMLTALYLLLAFTIALIATGMVRYRRQLKTSGALLLAGGGLALLAAIVAFLLTGWEAEPEIEWLPIQADVLDLENPLDPGSYPVVELSYGSGRDLHRPEFSDQIDWISDSVDGAKLIEGWEGVVGWARSGYWGFDATELPVQGRVWLPEGDGPFPLVLIVHGNHDMEDDSDVGYGYLGQHFASRGFVTVSVDENFLNSSVSDLLGGPDGGLDEESDARGWMLLQHLAQWRRWTADPGHPVAGKADLDRVVLIGHSRGGEAVSEAALFNRLPVYPDDGTLAFDFNFGILGIVAIAPVDSQYNPRDRDTDLEDVNFLVIHGSHDSDVNAFAGSAMYSRMRFEQCEDCFKSSFYLIGANHGQFNSGWGRYDLGPPTSKLLNVDPLMDPEQQRDTARVLFTAFLETVLNGREEYRPFLARPELGARWFPDGVDYLSNYGDGRQILLVDFEEDAHLLTAGETVESLSARGLNLWKEAEVPLKWRDMDSAAVLLGWGGKDSKEQPTYEIALLEGGLAVTPEMTLSFSAAMASEAPGDIEEFESPESLDFDVELVDSEGRAAQVALSARRPLYPQVDPVLYKLEALSDGGQSEVTFQRYAFHFNEWQAVNPDLNLNSLSTLRFLFPADTPASIWLDDVAISPDGY